ncbi:MAG: dihydroorotase [Leptospiraceae bacterium]|nr:dihydroorotase [Leptospiraceae bacterium]MCZ8345026.1 dihydroorotase [Leptospiraceae bacterium]
MSTKFLIKNATIVNEGKIEQSDVLFYDEIIQKVGNIETEKEHHVIDGTGKYLLPGIIDCQVHFRDPGNTHKGDLYTESKAAIAGGVTSFIDMPNTIPNALSLTEVSNKYDLASKKSLANYGFVLGVNSDNIDEIMNMDTSQLIGISDDGLYFTKKANLLSDNPEIMEKLFANCKSIIAIHSEKEKIIEKNEEEFKKKYGDDVPIEYHPIIRSERACYEATKDSIELANKYKAKLHILHLTTEAETHLFDNSIPLDQKRITTEVSVHHLWFCDKDYKRLGKLIKWNPAIKTEKDKKGLLKALIDDRIDIITTDHAPHTLEEKQRPYFQSMSGGPMVQHSLNCMLEFYLKSEISLQKVVEKMCHNPAILYKIDRRGYIKEGYYADLTLVDMNSPWTVNQENILYKCAWSPLEGTTFQAKIVNTFVNGNLVFENGHFNEEIKGKSLTLKNT